MNRFVIPLAVFIALIVVLGVGLRLNPRELPSPLIGKLAPAFTVPDLLSAQPFNTARMKDEVWLLNVWASWCVTCRAEHPLFNRLAATGNLPIVGLNYKDDADDATAWLQQLGNPYTHLPVDRRGAIGIDYGVYGVPETYLIDAAGIIRFKQIGAVTPAIVQHTLLPLIEKLRAGSN